jgi:tetratricopeptide (TPR) repeat protein
LERIRLSCKRHQPSVAGRLDPEQQLEELRRRLKEDFKEEFQAVLARDLSAAFDTVLAVGKRQVLKDKTGAAAEAVIDVLIAQRAVARERLARDEAALWRQKGALAFLRDTQAALQAYAKATELDPDHAEGWNQLAQLQERVGDLDAAIMSYERALALGNRSGDQVTIAIATGNLGIVYQTRGDLNRAEAMYRKALAINKALGHKSGMASQYTSLGILHWKRGDFDQAEEMYKKALAIDEALDRKEGMAIQYGNLGTVYEERGDLDRAEAMYGRALAMNEVLRRKEGIAAQYSNLGDVYKKRGDLAKACELWRRARELFLQVGARTQAERVTGFLRGLGDGVA